MKPNERERLLSLFQHAASEPTSPGEGACDDELLTAWRQRDLTTEEDERFLAHLDACAACRKIVVEFAKMLPQQPAAPTLPTPKSTRRFEWTAIVAIAACLVIGLAWMMSGGEEDEFARAREHLASGDPELALTKLEAIRPRNDQQRKEQSLLLEQATYDSASRHLSAGRYDAALAWRDRLKFDNPSSTRLKNLYLMASADPADRVPGELALAYRPTLLHWGFRPDGSHPEPFAFHPDPKREEAWRSAFEQYPDDEYILMNYGTFLLAQQKFHEAREVFTSRDLKLTLPTRSVADTGLSPFDGAAIALYGQGSNLERVELARKNFMADGRHLKTPHALINAAICLERFGKRPEARPLWEQALPQVSDPAIRTQIERHLARK